MSGLCWLNLTAKKSSHYCFVSLLVLRETLETIVKENFGLMIVCLLMCWNWRLTPFAMDSTFVSLQVLICWFSMCTCCSSVFWFMFWYMWMQIFGAAYLGPFGHFMHKLLDKIFKGKKDSKTVAKKVCFLYSFLSSGEEYQDFYRIA